ncbi:hypothetical protein [Leptolyngbya sp. FACHB-711]|jgi:uncharacterized membrane protein YccF (DUF307 family)|uniref:hypothetical protein n=1 Tax=unclassified Leptolyngbya TaxID=2650499 RepID=UPI001688BD90|nr:hypothetical protein [Leptolyngbya sp. FACHB-711]MBD1853223.1 hypothetical protein [Cyanobacteria bacterium FACHB-502]MBD2028100.1 hypothetical protein [Leptolyngbya sp. FACHB-711]
MLIRLLLVYLLVSLVVFITLLGVFWADHTTPKSDRLSWLLVCIGSFIWFITIPLSIIELTRKLFRRDILPKPECPWKTWN